MKYKIEIPTTLDDITLAQFKEYSLMISRETQEDLTFKKQVINLFCTGDTEKIEFFKKKYALTHPNISITLVKGRWQDVLYTCGVYNSIFFDDYTFEKDRTRYYNFLEQALTSHSHIGTRISSYATAEFTTNCDTVEMENKEFEVTVPPYCKYAKGDKMFLNILTKTEEYVTTTFAKKGKESKDVNEIPCNIGNLVACINSF